MYLIFIYKLWQNPIRVHLVAIQLAFFSEESLFSNRLLPFKMLTPARTFAVRAGKAALHPATSFSAVTRPTLRTYVGQGTVTYNEYNAREAPHHLQWNKLLESDSGESALLYAPVFYEPDDADAFLDEISCYVSVRLQPFFCFLHF